MRLDGLQWQEAGLAAISFWTKWYEAGWTAQSGWTVTRGWIGCKTILNKMVWGLIDYTIRRNSDKRLHVPQNHSEQNGMRLDGLHSQAEQWQEPGLDAEPFLTKWHVTGWTTHLERTLTRGWIGRRSILNKMVWGWMEYTIRLYSDKSLDWPQNHSEQNGMRLDGLHI